MKAQWLKALGTMTYGIYGLTTFFCGEVMASQVYSEGDPLTTLDYEGVYLGKE